MNFGDPRMLWLLLVLPPGMMVFFWWSARKRQALMQQFIRARLLPGLVAGVSRPRQKFRAAGLILAVMCLILALARPRWGYVLQEVTQRGLDIVVAIDTSKSMMAQDVRPNRLARAKLAALDLMQQAKSDRLGLVAFAGEAFLQCPLTIDDTAFRETLEALNVNTIPEGGTALARAIETAQSAFKEGENYRILVMFTDGEDLEPGAVAAAKAAGAKGLRIFTIGVGTAEGDLIRAPDAKGQMDYIRDENGNVVKSHLNTTLLEDIARATPGGFYLPLQGANTIDVLYQRGLAPLPRSESKERWLRRPQERYQWPLALAIVLLVGELLFPERKRQAPSPGRRKSGEAEQGRSERPPHRLAAAATVSAVVLLVLSVPAGAAASPSSALREYQSGKFDEALKQYEQSLQKRSDDLRLHFNAGTAAYQDQKFDQAARYFGDALTSPDLKLQQPAYYNLGNTLYHLGERNPDPQKRMASWEDALKQYDNAIQLNTNDADARFNYKYVKERLEELKKQQQQQQQNQNQQNQNQQNQQNQASKDQQQQQQAKNDQQQNQPPKPDQQQKSQSQQNQNQQSGQPQQQQPQQPQADSQKSDQNQQQQSSPHPEQARQQPQQNDREQGQEQKNQESAGQESGPDQKYAAGQMTPREAKQLLDSQKDKEMMLPASRKQEPTDQPRVVRDW